MPRTALTPQQLIGQYPVTPLVALSADITFAALDNANGNEFTLAGDEILLFRNDNVGAQTITITSALDNKNRLGSITTYSIGAALYAALGAFALDGWKQADKKLYIDSSSPDIKVAVLKPAKIGG